MNSFCPFIKEDCKSSCVFFTNKTYDETGVQTCKLSLAATSINAYCDVKTREIEDNLPICQKN